MPSRHKWLQPTTACHHRQQTCNLLPFWHSRTHHHINNVNDHHANSRSRSRGPFLTISRHECIRQRLLWLWRLTRIRSLLVTWSGVSLRTITANRAATRIAAARIIVVFLRFCVFCVCVCLCAKHRERDRKREPRLFLARPVGNLEKQTRAGDRLCLCLCLCLSLSLRPNPEARPVSCQFRAGLVSAARTPVRTKFCFGLSFCVGG